MSARVLTSALGDAAVPVVKGAAEDGILARLQHDIAAHESPHRAAAVSQQAAQRQRAGAVVGDPKHQHAQVQQVALCCVPAPETRATVFKTSLLFYPLYFITDGYLSLLTFSVSSAFNYFCEACFIYF